jgi:homoserine dehydrogenase
VPGHGWLAQRCPIDATVLRYDRAMDALDRPLLTSDRALPQARRVGLLGLGTVGSAVAARLLDPEWRANAVARGHVPPVLVAVAARAVSGERKLELPPEVRLSEDPLGVAGADDVDIVVELMGGTTASGDAIRQAFAAGKSVVSANKELLAKRGRELEAAAREAGQGLRFEAAVAGGVPLLGPLVWDLGANRMLALRGIVNGTTNHILSTMAADDREYDSVLREAQARGYAEADPSSDVEGLDAAYKLTLLARLAFDGWLDVTSLRRSIPVFGAEAGSGITGVTRVHMGVAARLGLAIKLIARAERTPAGPVRAAVTSMAVAATSPLGSTRGVTNLVHIDADPVGRVTMAGPGAGGPATASAVLADLLVLGGSTASTWEQLPPAGDLVVEDDLVGERGWLVVVEGLGEAGFPASIREQALAITDEGFVSRPMTLVALTGRLGFFDHVVHAYPILSDA